jgi:hypothetical protein
MMDFKLHLSMLSPGARYAVLAVRLHGFQPHNNEFTKWRPHEPAY